MNNRGRLRGSWFCLLISLIAACGCDNFAKIRNIRSDGRTIICFGDSLTEGVGAEPGEDYPAVLSRALGLPIITAGQRGDTTAEALARISDAVLNKNPRLGIVLLVGIDFFRQGARQETQKNLEEIVQRIQAQSAMVAIVGVKLGLFTDEYGSIFEETARQFGALYVA